MTQDYKLNNQWGEILVCHAIRNMKYYFSNPVWGAGVVFKLLVISFMLYNIHVEYNSFDVLRSYMK